ncbi:hypothetical protein B0H17DRAFT_1142928 [Mycena rosella]|uniref:Uncharacterized protein n=1 Tax=Mycena rosella TaxID=1033263 RepID=A0AAD7CWP8_MYCRO|nr:hypothetical protein B0H17DRAFT_1142928 [Mycena rosella]
MWTIKWDAYRTTMHMSEKPSEADQAIRIRGLIRHDPLKESYKGHTQEHCFGATLHVPEDFWRCKSSKQPPPGMLPPAPREEDAQETLEGVRVTLSTLPKALPLPYKGKSGANKAAGRIISPDQVGILSGYFYFSDIADGVRPLGRLHSADSVQNDATNKYLHPLTSVGSQLGENLANTNSSSEEEENSADDYDPAKDN